MTTKHQMEEMNKLLDVLFEQIEALPSDKKDIARGAVILWHHAKIQEELGLGPIETRHIYHQAYDAINEMGLEVGGMIKPYRGEFSVNS